MGDVIHNLPVVTDIHSHIPDAQIDWVVEESFAGIPKLHPGVSEVIPVALRRWRKSLLSGTNYAEMRAFKQRLQQTDYDLVLDTQGLIKSALIAGFARGTRCGYDWGSAREPLASLRYQRKYHVAPTLHAVERNRQLAAQALGYASFTQVDYGIQAPALQLPWLPGHPYAVLLHATSRDDKLWPESRWVEMGQYFRQRGVKCVLPWGSNAEHQRSIRLQAMIAEAVVPPAQRLDELAVLLAGARVVLGVDTGLSHLAAALKVPVVALYCGSDPALTGVYASGVAINLGSAGNPPALTAVIGAVEQAVA
jgi:heptosyltransferase-1